jgi:small redox-active disulfide protein 2
MKQIKILGTGCRKCQKLYDDTVEAVRTARIDAEVVKVEKIDEILAYGVMLTPALVIDGKVVSSGRALKAAEIVELLSREV